MEDELYVKLLALLESIDASKIYDDKLYNTVLKIDKDEFLEDVENLKGRLPALVKKINERLTIFSKENKDGIYTRTLKSLEIYDSFVEIISIYVKENL